MCLSNCLDDASLIFLTLFAPSTNKHGELLFLGAYRARAVRKVGWSPPREFGKFRRLKGRH